MVIPDELRGGLEAVQDDVAKVVKRRGSALLNLEPYREIRIQQGLDPNILETVDFRAIRGSVIVDIKTGGSAELAFSVADNRRDMLVQNKELGVPEFYGRKVVFIGGYAQPSTARRQLFVGRLTRLTPDWKENGEILLHYKAIGDLFSMTRIFRHGRTVYPRIQNTKQKEDMAEKLGDLGVSNATDLILEEWAVAEELTLGEIVREKIEQYQFVARVDDVYFGEGYKFTSRPGDDGKDPKQLVQINETDLGFISRLAREQDAFLYEGHAEGQGTVRVIAAGEIAFTHEDTVQDNQQEEMGFVYHTPYRVAGTKSYISPEEFDPRERGLFPILSVSADVDLLKFAAQGQVGVQTFADGTIGISLKQASSRPGLFNSNLRVVDQEVLDRLTSREIAALLISALRAPFDQRSLEEIQPVLTQSVGRRKGNLDQEDTVPLRINPGWKLTLGTVGTVHFQVGETYRVYNLAKFLEGWWQCRSVRLAFTETRFATTVALGWAGKTLNELGVSNFIR